MNRAETEDGYFRKGTNDSEDGDDYSFLYTIGCNNTMYIPGRKSHFMNNDCVCPKCGKIIIIKGESK